ncbi:MAG TPA: peptidoglycan editing factor PgeF [Anaerolineales bacterium]|nr:peptidoglycan editing factor PgeF [Anaerolineales bacterium]
MPFFSKDEISFYKFGIFGERLPQAVFTRSGGVSPDPWSSLNLGGTVGDDPERVRDNRQRALGAMGRNPASVFDVWQVHGVEVAIAEGPRPPETPHPQADVILTNRPGVTLMMRFADCVPVLLQDPVAKVVGIAHAGWVGTVRGTVRAAIEAMQGRFGSRPENILAAIGPSIGPDHYQVGPDVVVQVRQAFGEDSSGLLSVNDGSMYFDLWAANRLTLENAGVKRIEIARLCTACHTDDWFSHRAEKGRTGRFGAIIALS